MLKIIFGFYFVIISLIVISLFVGEWEDENKFICEYPNGEKIIVFENELHSSSRVMTMGKSTIVLPVDAKYELTEFKQCVLDTLRGDK